MRRLAPFNSSSSNNNNSNNIDINEAKVLEMGPRTVSLSVGNARWRGIERGQTTFIIRAGNCGAKSSALHSTHSHSSFTLRSVSIVFFCCMPFFYFFFLPFFARFFNDHTHTHCHHHAPLSLSLGIALYIKTCLEPHRIRTAHVPCTSFGIFLVLPLLIFLLPICPLHLLPLFRAFACSHGGGRCFVLSCSCLMLPCLFAFQVDHRPFSLIGLFVCCLSIPFLVYFTSVSLVSYSSTSKRRASLSHTCTITKFDS